MDKEALDQKTRDIFEKIGKAGIVNNFYLAGGTGLALQLGHRKSIDLDWFSETSFKVGDIKNRLSKIGELVVDEEKDDTLNCRLDGVRLSFFEYPYKLLFPFIDYNDNLRLADTRDIACMKIDAATSRGSKKDFIDIYFILQNYSLKEIMNWFEEKYKGIKYNRLHILKGLTYFADAEGEPMPLMLKDVDWEKVKKKITEDVKRYLE